MKKQILAAFLILLMVCAVGLMTACGLLPGGGQKDTAADEQDSATEQTEEPSAEQQAGEQETETDGETDPEGSSDPEDPANSVPTSGIPDLPKDEAQAAYIGVWKLTGILFSDGSVIADGSKGRYRIRQDGTYLLTGEKADTGPFTENGQWAMSEENVLLAGEAELLLDKEGRLLKYTGQRDGKGHRLYYVYRKIK